MIVADTNLIVELFLDSPRTELAVQVLGRDSHWAAPLLWRSEFRNVLATQVRNGRLRQSTALRMAEAAEELLHGHEYHVASEPVLQLTLASGCTAYDCEFVAIAKQQDVPLVTSDDELRRAFPEVAISPRNFTAA